MRNQVKTVSASQPTTQPPVTTKCITCKHFHDLDHDCGQHDTRATYSGGYGSGYKIVLECSGYEEAGQ
jgi:hypothetical protein